MIYSVHTYWLNIRKHANDTSKNVITCIPYGHQVREISDHGEWKQVGTYYHGKYIEGFVHSGYLVQNGPRYPELTLPAIPPVHLIHPGHPVNPQAEFWAHSLNDDNLPKLAMTSKKAKNNAILGVLEFLNVEISLRYRPRGSYSFCNVYAHDYAHLCGAYLPRVWWNEPALLALSNGKTLVARYGVTVHEMSANRLYDWFVHWAKDFGWYRTFEINALQTSANDGRVCVIVARRRQTNAPGHICLVIPESAYMKAIRAEGKVTTPVMSQAGQINKRFFTHKWWTHRRYSFFGFWVRD